jgi:glycerol kinase
VSPVILAIDQGSSASRCVALDAGLRPLALASRPLASAFPEPGRVEHDPAQITAGVLGSLRDALRQAGADWADVAAIGLAAQTETFVVWDRATGEPVYPAVSWRDGRAGDLCARLRTAGHERRVRELTGLPLESAFSAPKLAWLLAEVPGARVRAAAGELAFGDVNCWLTWQLSGGAAHVTEPSMAARTMLFDLRAGDWSAELLDLFGVPAAILPRIAPTAGRLAVTDPSVCGGRAVIGASAGDQQAALFGQHCWQAGQAKLTLGTGAFLWCHAGGTVPGAAAEGVVASVGWQLPGDAAYALEGFVPNSGGVLSWLRQLGVLPAGEWPVIRPGALRRPGARPSCVPALFGLGTPHWGDAARADITGLTAASTGADIAEAALLGVVHQVVDAIEAVQAALPVPVELVRVDGGLAGSDSALQAIADLAGITLDRPAVTEVTALGAGALAGLGVGMWDRATAGELLAKSAEAPGTPFAPALSDPLRAAARDRWRSDLSAALARWQADGDPLEAS